MLENIIDSEVKAEVRYNMGSAKTKLAHPKNNAEIFVNGKSVGYIALLHPKSTQKIGKNYAVSMIELNFALLAEQKQKAKKVDEITKYQINQLDLNFVIDSDEVYQNIFDALSSYKTDLDYSVKLVDVYTDENMLPGKKSMTFSFEISSKTHTLSGEELDKFQQDLIALAEKHGYLLR